MILYPKVTEQDSINLGKWAEQQKNQRAIKIKNKDSKQNLDKKLAESSEPLTKKLKEKDKSIKKLEKVFKKTNSENERLTQPAVENTQVQAAMKNSHNDEVIYISSL